MSDVYQVSTFDMLWEQIILPSIKYCFSNIEDPIKKQIKLNYKDIDKYKIELESMFKKKREWLKREYLPNKHEQAILDFHKLGAILCRCIIGNKPFSFNMKKCQKLFESITKNDNFSDEEKLSKQVNNIYINYKCAFLVYAGVAYIDLLYWADSMSETSDDALKKDIYALLKEDLLRRKSLVDYKKSPNHDNYADSMIVSFMKNDILLRDFDYLSIASSMFQWQMYTKQKILFDILINNNLVESKDILDFVQELL